MSRGSRAALGLVGLAACGGPVVSADLGLPVTVERPADGMCVSVQLDRWDADHRAAQVALLHALGVREIRQDLRWGYVGRSRDSWDWTTEDAIIDAAHAGDLGVIAMVGYGNPWASAVSGATEMTPPDDPADFAVFAGAAAARYGDRIDRYEVWNEPNSGFRFWQVGDPPRLAGDPAGYADLFVPAANAIHAADPNSEVEVGSVFYHGQAIPSGPDFIAAAVAHRPEILDVADAVSFHPYTLYPPNAAPEADTNGQIPVTQMVTDIEGAAPGLPVVVTEFGWPVWDTVTEDQQADWIIREIALLHASGVRDTCVYTLQDHPGPLGSPEDAFGLAERDSGRLRPAAIDYTLLADVLADVATANGAAETALGLPADVRAVRYVRTDGTPLTLLWSVGDPVDVVIPNVDGLDRCVTVTALAGSADGSATTGKVGPEGLTVTAGPWVTAIAQGPCP